MKRYLLLTKATFALILFFTSIALNAQNYTLSATPGTYTNVPVAGPGLITILISGDDQASGIAGIGFTFNYFGVNYTHYKVTTNGILNFNTSTTDARPTNAIENTGDPIIAPLWDDLSTTGSSGSVLAYTDGSSPNRVCTIQWLNYAWNKTAGGPTISFQIKLYETSNKIEFVYRQESTAVSSGSASIGLVRTTNQFISINNSSASPTLDPVGTNTISTKPATGQIYTFTPASSATPTTAATLNTITPHASSFDLNWTNGNGNFRAVFMKQTSSTSDAVSLSDGTSYRPSSAFGNATSLVGNVEDGWYCVYNGAGSSTTVTGLDPGFTYRVKVVEYNGLAGTQKYTATSGGTNAETVLDPPSGTASTIDLRHVGHNSLSFNIIEGDGDRRAVFVKASDTDNPPVVDKTTYTANTSFGAGTQIGTSGWYCVYDGAGTNNVTVSGLTENTNYSIAVVDYNGVPGVEKYNNTTVAQPERIKTMKDGSGIVYTFTAATTTFSSIAGTDGVVRITSIEQDDDFSPVIPLGFLFDFGGNDYDKLKASSNGFVTFNPYAHFSNSAENHMTDVFDSPLLAPLWDDLNGESGNAYYLTSGEEGHRVFTLEYSNWKWDYDASEATISFQVKLYENDSKIEFIYKQEAGAVSTPSASIGLHFDIARYLLLNNATAGANASTSVRTTNISTKPATGQVFRFTPPARAKASQTVTFNALPEKTYGDAPFTLSASASSGLSLKFSSSNPAVATVTGNTITIIGAGTTTITATQIGNRDFLEATAVDRTLTVRQASQTITFNALSAKTLGDAPFDITATSNSGLPVSLSATSDKITLNGTRVTLVKPGTVTIKAEQAGNANYAPANAVERTFCINPSKPVITTAELETGETRLTSSVSTGNEWYKDGVLVATTSSDMLTTAEPGAYTVRATVEGCASAMSESKVITITEIEEQLSNHIKVYPNPVRNEFTVEGPALQQPVTVALVDVTGKTLQTWSGKNKITCNVANRVAGNYVLLIAIGERTATKQIVKK